ncbi:related to RMS1 - regulatory protein [Cephalotrichum gorgonifer]|uniref:Related to RMS1 - regulatory protein n=1 Tax=Cephalotrichum gorgonifer TaxID=2041049 RepID=A0AAE8MUC1_9PEZI|nr:related to RMS1 - regulatory protein [Cephalotrichum gorgonifer]
MGDKEFEAQNQGFLTWFKSIPGSTFSDSLSLTDLRARNAGRGIIANVDIPANTLLFTIPRPGVINITTSDLFQRLPDLLSKDLSGSIDDDDLEDSSSDPWLSLILVLIYEYLQGERSRWKAYFDILPVEFDTPMFWSEEDLMELQASSVVSKIGKAEADSMFLQKVVPAVTAHQDVFYGEGSSEKLSELELLNLAHRMGSLIMAYAFDLDKEDDDEDEEMEVDAEDGWVEDKDSTMLGMVPMADILNSDAEFNAHVDHAGDAITVTSLREIKQGEEVLNYYGPLANSDLLRRYGYISHKHRRYDVVEIPQTLLANQVQQALGVSDAFKDKALSFLGEDAEDPVLLERDAGEPNWDGTLVAPVRSDTLLSELDEAVTTMLKSFRRVSASVVPDKRKREETRKAVLPLIISARLAEYPTTLLEDTDILANAGTVGRHRMAVEVRAGEKKLLQEALEVAAAAAAHGTAADEDNGNERPGKRSKAS